MMFFSDLRNSFGKILCLSLAFMSLGEMTAATLRQAERMDRAFSDSLYCQIESFREGLRNCKEDTLRLIHQNGSCMKESPACLCLYGLCLTEGVGVGQDLDGAMRIFRNIKKEAETLQEKGALENESCYRIGVRAVIDNSLAVAKAYHDQGLHRRCIRFLNGIIDEMNRAESNGEDVSFCTQVVSSKQNDIFGCYLYGVCLASGIGVEQDFGSARRCFLNVLEGFGGGKFAKYLAREGLNLIKSEKQANRWLAEIEKEIENE
ncbi:MAG: hypothetical protein LBQ43_02855 [Holosporales bacterium]|nr:hypothetical protein [Holosporales bacterium]